MQSEVADQQIPHRLDVRASHLAGRLTIAILNLLLAVGSSYLLILGSTYLSGTVIGRLGFDRDTLFLLIMTLSSLAVVVFATATAIVALRQGFWRLKYQLFCLAGVAALFVPWPSRPSNPPESDPTGIRYAGASAEFAQLLQEIDTALEASNKSRLEASALFDQLLADAHNVGLAKVRQEQKEVGPRITDLFGKSIEQKRLAVKKSEEAAQKETRAKFKPFFTHKAQSYEFYAQVLEINQEIVRLVFDESIASADGLKLRVEEAEKRRLAVGMRGNEADAKARAIAQELQDNPG
jgi:hypothetical protein